MIVQIFCVLQLFTIKHALSSVPKLARGYCSSGHPGSRRSTFLPVCATPVENLIREAPFHDGADEIFLEDIPDWLDLDFASIGQKFGQKNAFSMYYSMLLGFLPPLVDPEIRKVLYNSGNIHTPEDSAKRFLSNFLHTEFWFFQDIRGNRSNLINSLNSVRAHHLTAVHRSKINNTILRKPIIPEPNPGENPHNIDVRIWNAFEADLWAAKSLEKYRTRPAERFSKHAGQQKLLMNQHGMAITQFLQMGFPILYPQKVFILDATTLELEAYMHFWAFLFKAIGLEDQFNICLQTDLKTARVYFNRILYETMVPNLFILDYEAKVTYENMFKGLNNAFSRKENTWAYNMNNLADIFLLRLLEDILKIPTPNMRAALTPFEKSSHAAVQWLLPRYNGGIKLAGNVMMHNVLKLWSDRKFNVDTANAHEIADGLIYRIHNSGGKKL